jgi:TolA-binding protein
MNIKQLILNNRQFFALFCGLLVACSSSWQDSLDKAKSLQAEKRYQEAVVLYQKSLDQYPENVHAPSIYLEIAQIYEIGLRDQQGALKQYDEIVTRFPMSLEAVKALEKQAHIYEAQKDWEGAIEKYALILSQFPQIANKAHYQLQIGIVSFKRSHLNEAKMTLETYLQNFPDDDGHDQADFYLGEIHFHKKNFEKALGYYQEIVDHHKNSSLLMEAHYNVGLCSEYLGEWDRAIKIYSELLAVHPNKKMLESQIESLKKLRKKAGRG